MNLSYAKLFVMGLSDNANSSPPLANSPLFVPAVSGGFHIGGNYRILLINK